MSAEAVRDFIKKAQSDPALAAKLKGLPRDESAAIKQVVNVASGAGFNFTEQDYRQMAKQHLAGGELKEEDLAKVSGGTITTIIMVTMTICRV